MVKYKNGAKKLFVKSMFRVKMYLIRNIIVTHTVPKMCNSDRSIIQIYSFLLGFVFKGWQKSQKDQIEKGFFN